MRLEGVKACSRCGRVLPADPAFPELAGFYVGRRNADGSVRSFGSRCRSCCREVRQERTGSVRVNRAYRTVVDGVERRVKLCAGCGQVKIAEEGAADSGFYVVSRKGGHAAYGRLCKTCWNAGRVERYREDQVFRESQKEWRRRWVERNLGRAREKRREWEIKWRREHREEHNERQRMAYHLRRERLGLPRRPLRVSVIDGTRPEVPLGPFAAWLAVYQRARGLSVPELAEEVRLGERRVRAWLSDGQPSVSVDVVSRALTEARVVVSVGGRTVVTFDDLYPDVRLRERRHRG